MNLVNRIKAALSPSRPVEMQFQFLGNGVVTWFPSNPNEILKNGYLGNDVVFSVQDWKSQKCAMAPPLAYRIKDKKKYSLYRHYLKNMDAKGENFHRAYELSLKALDEVEGHPMLAVLENPNPLMSSFEFWYGLQVYIDQVGSGYIFGVRDGVSDPTKGKVTQMWLPHAQQVVIESGGMMQPISSYFLNSNPTKKISVDNVCQIRNFSPIDSGNGVDALYGLPRMYAGKRLLYSDNKATEAEAATFQDRGVKDIIFPKGQTDPNAVTEVQATKIKNEFNSQLRQVGVGGVMVSTVELSSIKMGYSPKEMGYLDSRAANKAAICSMYQLPVELFNGGDNATYNNMDIFVKKALIDAVLPEYEKKKDALTNFLARSYDPDNKEGLVVDYNLDYFTELQKNKEELMKWMNEGNCFTPNERRVAVGYEPSKEPNAEKITVSSSVKLLDDMDVTSFDNTDDELI